MKLTIEGLKEKSAWTEDHYSLPQFDREIVTAKTKENPTWIHFGAGNIFRAFQAKVVQNLLNKGILDRGLIVAEGFDYEIIEKMNRPHDNYTILVTLKADGNVEKTVIGSIVESLRLDSQNEIEFLRLKEIFEKDSLQIASFTITEKGYSLVDGQGNFLLDVAKDFKEGTKEPKSYMGKIASLLYTRFQAGEKPIAMVSMDNCSHNGEKLYTAMKEFAKQWVEHGKVEEEFLSYVCSAKKVSFPFTMIDKITPRPDEVVKENLKKDGIEELDCLITSKNTYVAPFVNAEECEYLVIEDSFPNGRPPLEQGGFIFTKREIVENVEKMKVCTCLNPLHTALAIFGCLLGYKKISEEMKDQELKRLVERIGYVEGMPVVVDPVVINPKEFLDQVLKVRIPNPFMPDTPQRIATDTSQKLGIRFGETVKAYQQSQTLSVDELEAIPLVFAGWIRYLMGIDDEGKEFELSPDPLLDTVLPYVSKLKLEKNQNWKEIKERILPLLKMKQIFGVDLEEVGLSEKVCHYLEEMTKEIGAVKKVLKNFG